MEVTIKSMKGAAEAKNTTHRFWKKTEKSESRKQKKPKDVATEQIATSDSRSDSEESRKN